MTFIDNENLLCSSEFTAYNIVTVFYNTKPWDAFP